MLVLCLTHYGRILHTNEDSYFRQLAYSNETRVILLILMLIRILI